MNFPQLKRLKKHWFDKNCSCLCLPRCNYKCELCKWYRTLCIGIPFYDLDLLPNIITAITGIRIQELHYQFILYLKIQFHKCPHNSISIFLLLCIVHSSKKLIIQTIFRNHTAILIYHVDINRRCSLILHSTF